MKLWCATGNAGKLREFRMAAQGRAVEIDILPEFRAIPACDENGATFEENAVIKAVHYGPHAGGLLFADDSGLEVDALGGAPGVRSARFSGPVATDASNNELLRQRLQGVADRTARFVCVIALVEGTRLLGTFRGSVEGTIIGEERGARGFGYDPMFFYPPYNSTFGEAGDEEKFAVSHRGQALRKMLQFLKV